jgi:hypothetical protein
MMALPLQAKQVSRHNPYNINTCNYSHYWVNNQGQCIDLHEPNVTRYNGYEEKFFNALKKIGISLSFESCEAGLMGHYKPAYNRLTICQNNRRDFSLYIETLAHESWHVVQDCAAGLNNDKVTPIVDSSSSRFRASITSLNSSDWKSLNLYKAEDLPYEVEAFFMSKHPDTVLEALDICSANLTRKK